MTNKSFIVFAVLFAVLLAPIYPIYAEENTSAVAPTKKVEAKRAATEKMAQAATNDLKMRVASKGADIKNNVASRTADLKDKMASREAALKAKLATFRDKKKATTIERINLTFATINKIRTGAMLGNIETMEMILGKADERSTAALGEGKDVTPVVTDLGQAKNALANAKTAVDAQSKKTYDITIASESGAKADVKVTRDMLEKDLKSTHQLVIEARRVLINAITKLAQTIGEPQNGTN